MESLLKSVTLTQDVVRALDEIRAGAENALYGAESDKSQELFTKHVVSLVEGAGLPVLQTMHYRWFLRELARLWRTRTGRDLAFHLELCIRKWVGLGLEPRTLQFLVTEAHERLKGKFECRTPSDECRTESVESVKSVDVRSPDPDSTTKTQRHEEAKGGDMTGLSDNTDRVPSPNTESLHSGFDARMCQPMAGPRPQAGPVPAADEQEQQ